MTEMSIMTCKICNSQADQVFTSKVLNKYDVSYFQCTLCGFIQTEKTYWLNEAYTSAINLSDTGIIARNEHFRRIIVPLLVFYKKKQARFLDYAGGYGIFTRMMRDVGFDYYWLDEYAQNLVSRGFEHKKDSTYEAITAFEVFEHLDDPHERLTDMLKYSDTIFFSTELVPQNIDLEKRDWWYFAFSHGQHIAFYTKHALRILAEKHQLNFYTNGSNFHVLTKNRINEPFFKLLIRLSKYGLYKLTALTLTGKTQLDSAVLSEVQ